MADVRCWLESGEIHVCKRTSKPCSCEQEDPAGDHRDDGRESQGSPPTASTLSHRDDCQVESGEPGVSQVTGLTCCVQLSSGGHRHDSSGDSAQPRYGRDCHSDGGLHILYFT